jgi:hypothetical protein
MLHTTPFKLAKQEFKCFHCRLVFKRKDGDWFNWEHMQVHLCRGCEKKTKGQSERG